MLRKRNAFTFAIGLSVWLAAILLASTGSLAYSNMVSAQQGTTDSTLATPTLSAEAGESGVALSWTAVQGAARYELYTWTKADGWWEIGGDNLTATTFTHADATVGTTYYYSVRAVNADGDESDWSVFVSATAGSFALSAPALTAAAGEDAIVVSWDAVEGAVRYELWAWTNADGWEEIGGDSLTGTTFTHTDATGGTTYYYSARAVNAYDAKSEWSDYVHATITPTTDPLATATPTPTITPTTDPLATATPTPTITSTPAPLATATPTPTVTPTPDPLATATPTPTITPTATPASSASDRAALVAFYNATNGGNWTNNDNWLSAEPLGTWYGVTTDENGRVTALRFYGNNLIGTIPSLSSLTELQHLDLQNNKLTGTIPSLSSLTNLTRLNLSQNRLSGSIPSPSSLTKLQYLYLRENRLSGSIPSLSSQTELIVLSLYKNRLSGSIPSLGTKPKLVGLLLNDNKLSGSIPSLSSLTGLAGVYLQNNTLSGTIPNLSPLRGLQELRLNNNKLTGSIPDLSNNRILVKLYLNDNRLTGTVPSSLGDLQVLSHLYLANNRLSGCIPASLRSVSNSDLASLGLTYCGEATATPTATPTPTPTPTPTSTPTQTPTPG